VVAHSKFFRATFGFCQTRNTLLHYVIDYVKSFDEFYHVYWKIAYTEIESDFKRMSLVNDENNLLIFHRYAIT